MASEACRAASWGCAVSCKPAEACCTGCGDTCRSKHHPQTVSSLDSEGCHISHQEQLNGPPVHSALLLSESDPDHVQYPYPWRQFKSHGSTSNPARTSAASSGGGAVEGRVLELSAASWGLSIFAIKQLPKGLPGCTVSCKSAEGCCTGCENRTKVCCSEHHPRQRVH
jgi:hypothetical protein